MPQWPKQSEADTFYGNPRGRGGNASASWETENLAYVSAPFDMNYAGRPVSRFRMHNKCAPSLTKVLTAIWQAAGENQDRIDEWGVSTFGGAYNYRLMRGSDRLSMHAYGCAIDLAPQRFPMGKASAMFAPEVREAFADEGWVNLKNDRMHFQAAIV